MFVSNLGPTSAYAIARNGGPIWGVTDYLLADVVDLLQEANWQRQGKKNAPRPKPVKRPGQEPQGKTYGSKPIPVGEFDDWWDKQGE